MGELELGGCSSSNDDVSLANKTRFPSTVSFAGGAVTPYGQAFVSVLSMYGWKRVAVIVDNQSRNPIYPTRGKISCSGALSELAARKTFMNYLEIPPDSTLSNQSITESLEQAAQYSRGKLICSI